MMITIYFIISLITSISSIYILTNIINCDFKKNRMILGILFLTVSLFITKYIFTNNIYTTILYFIFSVITSIMIFPTKIYKSIISTFMLFVIYVISEIIISILFLLLKIDLHQVGTILNISINVSIYILSIFILNIPVIKKNINLIVKNFEKHRFVITLIMISIFIFLIVKNFSLNNNILVIISFTFIILIILLLFYNILEQEKIKQSNIQYDELLKVTNNYEKIIDERMRRTHEYKNQLLIIKSMTNKQNKELHNYIKELMNNTNLEIDQKILLEIQKIPFTTFNGMLYYKIIEANQKNINIELDISNVLEKKALQKVSEKDIRDICKLTGIFMDNAIEGSKDVVEKQISISIYIDSNNNLVFSIANKFYGIINTKNLKSTKGKNHGYGLMIAKDIVTNNPKINNTQECISNVFIQNILLKLK